jgi:hypothetical protein
MIFQFLLFLLSFLLSFGFLRKTKIFPKTVDLIISIVIAFYMLFASIYYFEEIVWIFAGLFLLLLIIFALALLYLAKRK